MIEVFTLKNGVRIVAEHVPSVRSCAIGLWTESGTRNEPKELGGISHFIEHMLFKGTATRTAAELAAAFDGIGGQVNAFTTKENTCYYARTLDTHLLEAADLLCDMFFNSTFGEAETNLERGVIEEEIGMYEDTPEDLVHERLTAEIYRDSTLGLPVLGTKQTLANINGETLRAYQKSHYLLKNTVISVAGSFSREDLANISARFEQMQGEGTIGFDNAGYNTAFALKKKDNEQNHICIAFPGINCASDERYLMQVMSNVLGGGMSSRLFQRVREESGLCYAIYSYAANHLDTGYFGIYTALGKKTEMQAIKLIHDEVEKFLESGPTDEEVARSKEQLKSSTLMGLENMNSRMVANARNLYIHGRVLNEDDIIKGYDSVSREGVHALAKRLLDFGKVSFSAVGQVASEEEYRKNL